MAGKFLKLMHKLGLKGTDTNPFTDVEGQRYLGNHYEPEAGTYISNDVEGGVTPIAEEVEAKPSQEQIDAGTRQAVPDWMVQNRRDALSEMVRKSSPEDLTALKRKILNLDGDGIPDQDFPRPKN